MSGCLGPCDLPNVLTISSESGTVWLGGITEFNQYQASAARSKDAGELLHLPKEFRTFYPFRRSDSGPGVFLYPNNAGDAIKLSHTHLQLPGDGAV
jgi:hypothetical protein